MILDRPIPEDKYAEFEMRVKRDVPFGFNINEHVVIDEKEFYKFLTTRFNMYRNMWPEMLMDLPDTVTEKWVLQVLDRVGMDVATFYKSLGSVGGGNHFVEYDETDDKSVAGVTLHFGSRNFGVKVCKYWMNRAFKPAGKSDVRDKVKVFKDEYRKTHKDMSDFQSALDRFIDGLNADKISGYLNGDDMKGYLMDMCFAQCYAEFNHITVRSIIRKILLKYGIKEKREITSVHNYIDLNDHTLRKSAIRSYEGEEILVPFNMRDGIAVCEGLSNQDWLNSCAHGAGRKMSRSEAKRQISMDEFRDTMKGVYSTTVCEGTIDESPQAYKDTQEIKDLITETCKVNFMMRPRINIKAAN